MSSPVTALVTLAMAARFLDGPRRPVNAVTAATRSLVLPFAYSSAPPTQTQIPSRVYLLHPARRMMHYTRFSEAFQTNEDDHLPLVYPKSSEELKSCYVIFMDQRIAYKKTEYLQISEET